MAGSIYKPKYKDKDTGEVRESKVYWVAYRYRGKLVRESAKSKRKGDARDLLNKRLGEVSQGKLIVSQRVVFNDLVRGLLDDYRINGRRSVDRVQRSCNHLLEALDGALAENITADVIARYTTSRIDEGAANATVNRELAALKRIFTLAIRSGKLASRPYIAMLQEDNVRKGFFERQDLDALVHHLPPYLKPVVMVAYITGWRIKSEVLTRQWHHVDLNHGWIRLEPGETKNRKGRMFPFIPELQEALEEQRRCTEALQVRTARIVPWVFNRDGDPIKDYRSAWTAASRKAGIPGKVPHDFRRTAIRNLERAGVPRSAAMEMVGHQTESVYRRYAIADEGLLKESALQLAKLNELDRSFKVCSKSENTRGKGRQ